MHARWLITATLIAGGCDRLFDLEHVPNVASDTRMVDNMVPDECAPRSVAPGRDHTCSVDHAGRVYCWGINDSGQTKPDSTVYRVLEPSEVVLPSPATQVTAGRSFSCALLETGEVWCWGSGESGALGVATDGAVRGPVRALAPAAVEVSAGGYHACIRAAADGSVWCWGTNDQQECGQVASPTSLPALVAGTVGTKAMELGHRHSCVIDANDRVACWGRNHRQQLGDNGGSRATPTVIATFGASRDISASGQTTCALDLAGRARCLGTGTDGQLGNGQFINSITATTTSITDATSVSVGGFGSCALRAGGVVSCWGSHDAGNGTFVTRNTPQISDVTGVTQLETNFFHSCAIANNDITCWGNDLHGQLGRGDRGSVLTLQPVTLPEATSQVVAGTMHVCALGASGQIRCWGKNDYGEGTDAELKTAFTPMTINPNLSGVTTLVGAFDHTCAFNRTLGTATCWGKAYWGALGTGVETRHVAVPAAVQISNITHLALGYEHMCVREANFGAIRCYGLNTHGQLGAATPDTSAGGITAITAGATEVATGERFSCAIVGGSIQCWGANDKGQLGDTTLTSRATPAPVSLGAGYDMIGAGRQFACARQTTTGSVYCWGTNTNGEIGQGTRSSTPVVVPVRVLLPDPANVVALWVGYAGACAKLPNGKVYCWGDSDEGQAGTGSENDVLTPTEIPSVMGATSVALGTHGICFVTGGQLTCAGERRMLGNNDNSRSLPARPGLPSCN